METRICYYLRTAEQLGQVLIRVYLSIREAHAENSGLFSSHPFFIIVAHVAFLPSPIQHTLILIRTLFCSFTIQRILTAQIRGAPVRAGQQRVPWRGTTLHKCAQSSVLFVISHQCNSAPIGRSRTAARVRFVCLLPQIAIILAITRVKAKYDQTRHPSTGDITNEKAIRHC